VSLPSAAPRSAIVPRGRADWPGVPSWPARSCPQGRPSSTGTGRPARWSRSTSRIVQPRSSSPANPCGDGGVPVQDKRFGRHQEPPDGAGGSRPGKAAVHAGHTAVPPQRQVQVRDIGVADDRLGIRPDGTEIDVIGDPVGAGPAPGGDHSPHRRVTGRLVQVREPTGIPPGHVTPAVQGMPGDLRDKARPSTTRTHGLLNPPRLRPARRRTSRTLSPAARHAGSLAPSCARRVSHRPGRPGGSGDAAPPAGLRRMPDRTARQLSRPFRRACPRALRPDSPAPCTRAVLPGPPLRQEIPGRCHQAVIRRGRG
jgi:hypothetical protein